MKGLKSKDQGTRTKEATKAKQDHFEMPLDISSIPFCSIVQGKQFPKKISFPWVKEYFFGHLEGEPEACVALTGCPGSDDLEFTILSEHSPDTMFKWFKNGAVEAIKNPFRNGEGRSEKMVHVREDGDWTLVGGDEEVNQEINANVIKYFKNIQDKNIQGITNVAPSYNKLIVSFDLEVTNYSKVKRLIEDLEIKEKS